MPTQPCQCPFKTLPNLERGHELKVWTWQRQPTPWTSVASAIPCVLTWVGSVALEPPCSCPWVASPSGGLEA